MIHYLRDMGKYGFTRDQGSGTFDVHWAGFAFHDSRHNEADIVSGMWQSDLATYHKQQVDSEDPVVNLATIQQHYLFRYLQAVDVNLAFICICTLVGHTSSVQNFTLRLSNLHVGLLTKENAVMYKNGYFKEGLQKHPKY